MALGSAPINGAIYRLDTEEASVLVRCVQKGGPSIVYWGARLPDHQGDTAWADHGGVLDRAVPHGGFDALQPLFLVGASDTVYAGQPILTLRRESGPVRTVWRHTSILEAQDALCFKLTDPGESLEISVRIEVVCGLIVIGLNVTNSVDAPLFVDHCAVSIPIPERLCRIRVFHGQWCGEFQQEDIELRSGLYARESRAGRASHHGFPGFVLSERPPVPDAGECLAVHLGWSGNHRMGVEQLSDGRRHIFAGPLLEPGEICLSEGQTFHMPSLYGCQSQKGLNGIRACTHRFVRSQLVHRKMPPHVQLNTWEVVYFDHDLDRLTALATDAAALGVERFVLDDGWFGRRTDDRRGLGDWYPRPSAYPDGLTPLSDHVRGLGMTFGLWIEPEMVSADSTLFEMHPDWILGPSDQTMGRTQYCLDLAQPDCFTHLRQTLLDLVGKAKPDSLKWDMNRDRVGAITQGQPSNHRQVLALYRLMDDLRQAYPKLEIEACSSGGGRLDYGIVARCDRIWLSDAHDPDIRAQIFEGFSVFFPPELAGMHVGPSPSHLTGRSLSMEARIALALLGGFGLELDVCALALQDKQALQRGIAFFKRWRPLFTDSRFEHISYRDESVTGFRMIEAGGRRSLIAVFQRAPRNLPSPGALPLCGVNPDFDYILQCVMAPQSLRSRAKRQPAIWTDASVTVSGAALLAFGLPLPVLAPGEAAILSMEACVT